MATHTLTTSVALTCVAFSPAPGVLSQADLATISQLIKNDLSGSAHPTIPGSFCREGFLYVPRRSSQLQVFPGDVVAVDANGWPILVSAYSIATGGWTFT